MNTGRYDWLDTYLKALPGATSDFKVEWEWYRYLVGGKMFAALCQPDETHAAYGGRPLISLKCDPILSELLRTQYADVVPGFYMDKRCWISIYLDGAVPDEVLRGLCNASYDLIFQKLTKKLRAEIAASGEGAAQTGK